MLQYLALSNKVELEVSLWWSSTLKWSMLISNAFLRISSKFDSWRLLHSMCLNTKNPMKKKKKFQEFPFKPDTFCKILFLTSSLLACNWASSVASRCSRLRSFALAVSIRSFSLSMRVCAILVCFKRRFSCSSLSLASRWASSSFRRNFHKTTPIRSYVKRTICSGEVIPYHSCCFFSL